MGTDLSERRFATRSERVKLFLAADGVCTRCGSELDETFEADHRRPYSSVPTTNVHEMQALCARCNATKGDTMLRLHQQQADDHARAPEVGTVVRRIIADVTPGGGKSALPVIIAHRLISRGVVDAICWVVPRDNLRRQAEEAFQAAWLRRHIGHSLEVRAARNDINPRRKLAGYATTYQAVLQEPELHADEFRRARYALFLDEVHHAAVGSPYHRTLAGMVEAAAVVVLMSGTFSRADGQQIAFLDYEQTAPGKIEPVLRGKRADTRVVSYSRKQALDEHAIIPLFFERLDGEAAWIGRDGSQREVASLRGLSEETPAALFTALSQGYADALLERTVEHWRGRQQFTAGTRLLVVAPSIVQARRYLERLRAMGVEASDIATSDDTEEAVRNIRRLRGEASPSLDALVTVAMAYEGMDCPTISHIACLTHVRAREWIEQMLARGVRVDPRFLWVDQEAWVFAPDDDLFSQCVAKIRAEQQEALTDRDRMLAERGPVADRERRDIVPISAAATVARGEGLDEGDLGTGEYEHVVRVAREVGLMGINPLKLREFAARLRTTSPVEPAAAGGNGPTPSEREKALRTRIDELIGGVARADVERCWRSVSDRERGPLIGKRKKELNAELVRSFGIGRSEAPEPVLREMWAFLVRKYQPEGGESRAGTA